MSKSFVSAASQKENSSDSSPKQTIRSEVMFPCINQATVMPADTIRFLELARKHSFATVELDIAKVEECIRRVGLDSLLEKIHESNLRIVSLNAIENYPIMTQEEMKGSLQRCEEIIHLARSLNCDIVVVNPNEVKSPEQSKMATRFDELMNQTGKMAKDHHVRLGFEYVSYDERVIHSLAESLSGIHRWNHGIGLVLDAFHMYRSGEKVSDIPSDDAQLLWAFHINDAPASQISVLRDTSRLMPLEGVMNVREFVRDLQALNFDGPISVELFNEKYWEMDADSVLAKAKSSLDALGV